MSRLLCPILLLASATIPSAALALGLGELHVESALGQQFVAQIDLIDASPEDLARLQASIADEDAFQRSQLERPGFLVGTTVTLGQNAQGQPVLLLRSKDSFTEPVVTFLVDVRWRTGELIREYTALLDPSELASRTPAVAPATEAPYTAEAPEAPPSAARVAPVSASPTPVAASAPAHEPQLHSHKVVRGDTLARIAITAGARSPRERHRMMIAIYRANPAAFQKGLNFLQTGEILRMPTAAELAAISPADADREFQAQLTAMHRTGRRKLRGHSGKHAENVVESKADPAPVSLESDKSALSHRVESLERSLQEVRRELQERTQQTQQMQQTQQTPQAPPASPVRAAVPAPKAVLTTTEPGDDSAPPPYSWTSFIAVIGALGLVLAAGLWWFMGRRRDDHPRSALLAAVDSRVTAEPEAVVPSEVASAEIFVQESAASMSSEPLVTGASAEASAEPSADTSATSSLAISAAVSTEAEGEVADTGDTTAVLAPDMTDHKFSFYNPESHLDTTHVVMGSDLTRPLAFVERRKNPAIVLQQAIEREPQRSDLHLKLLELYYASASENRLAFLEAARQIMHRQGLVSAEDWARIVDMGRQIAPDDELFRTELDDQAVA